MLNLENLSKSFSSVASPIVRNICLKVDSGSFTAILGENGAGKSTILKLCYGLLVPDAGNITYKGVSMDRVYDALLPGHPDMAWVDQKTEVLPYHTVAQNVEQKLRRFEEEERAVKLEFLKRFFAFENQWEEKAVNLSGGFQQRLCIARAIAEAPEVLLLDEPFSQQDPSSRMASSGLLKKINEELGTTILLASHQVQDAFQFCRELIFIDKGKIQQKGSPRELYFLSNSVSVAHFMGLANLYSGEEFELLFPEAPEAYMLPSGQRLLRPIEISARNTKVGEEQKFVVSSLVFRGQIFIVTAKHASGKEVIFNSKIAYKEGDFVYLQYRPFYSGN